MDNLHSQSGQRSNAGHEESDISVRGIVVFAVILVVCGVAALGGSYGFLRAMDWWEKSHDAKLTPMEQKLQQERTGTAAASASAAQAEAQGVKAAPDWYGRGEAEKHLRATFATPRLQYDDTYDMDLFVRSEKEWLTLTGRDQKGHLHIPISRAMDILAQRGLPPVSGTFSTAKPAMPPPLPTVWQEVPVNGAQPQGPRKGGVR